MKRTDNFPENIFSFKMIDVPAEWQARRAICKQLYLKEKRKKGRKREEKEGGTYMMCFCINIHVHLCTKITFKIRILIDIYILEAAMSTQEYSAIYVALTSVFDS